MASLPTLALGTYTNVSSTAITGAEPVLQTIAATNDAKYVSDATNSNHTGTAQFTLDDVPADFGNMDTASIRLRYARQTGTAVNTWNSLTAQIVQSDGSTPLTNEVTVASGITTTTATNSGVTTLTGVDTASGKAVWDGALVLIRWNITRNMAGDTLERRVFAAEVTGTYTAPPSRTGTGTLSSTLASTMAGAGVETIKGTGALISALVSSMAGAGVETFKGTGALASTLVSSMAGAGVETLNGTGALVSALVSEIVGSGVNTPGAPSPVTGTGDLVSALVSSMAGAGFETINGTGDLVSALVSSMAGAGVETINGTGDLVSALVSSMAGAGVETINGTGDLVSALASTMEGSGVNTPVSTPVTGTGALVSALVSSMVGVGVETLSGTGVLASSLSSSMVGAATSQAVPEAPVVRPRGYTFYVADKDKIPAADEELLVEYPAVVARGLPEIPAHTSLERYEFPNAIRAMPVPQHRAPAKTKPTLRTSPRESDEEEIEFIRLVSVAMRR